MSKHIIGEKDNQYRYKVWMEQATFDLAAAHISLNNSFFEWSCFQSQQAAEKALKALIAYHGKSVPKVHKLGVLVGMIKSFEYRLRGIHIDISELQSYTFITRYPFLIPGEAKTPHKYIKKEEAEICIKKATIILNLIQGLLDE
ncbi:MAG: HEPN domain-containing protein [Candidatus Dojkabacteria bacterium]|nr:HEPN domain-containing protein [Candidatus Dojkabacteria bacterium]